MSGDYRVTTKPILSEEKKADLKAIATYSEGQANQMEILCDFVPCSRTLAGWLKRELGL